MDSKFIMEVDSNVNPPLLVYVEMYFTTDHTNTKILYGIFVEVQAWIVLIWMQKLQKSPSLCSAYNVIYVILTCN